MPKSQNDTVDRTKHTTENSDVIDMAVTENMDYGVELENLSEGSIDYHLI